jgi:hypothetical protein
MQSRLAFTAELWGDEAVVCRAIENRAGPVVDPEFGVFETWTHANAFATKLNQGLEIDPVEARQIITSSMLATTSLIRAFLSSASDLSTGDAPVLVAANTVQVELVLAELRLALTFCRLAREVKPGRRTGRMLRNARNALYTAMNSLCRLQFRSCELEEILAKVEMLEAALQEFPPEQLNVYRHSCLNS